MYREKFIDILSLEDSSSEHESKVKNSESPTIGSAIPPSHSAASHAESEGSKSESTEGSDLPADEGSVTEDKKEAITVKPFMANTLVIAAFVNLGKSVYCENHDDSKDIDTSLYARKPDGSPNPEYPDNYIEIIKHHLTHCNWKYLFVSSNRNIRKGLDANRIKYVVLYPTKDRKQEWIDNAKKRGNSDAFIEKVTSNWDSFIDELAALPNSYGLKAGEYINDDLFNKKLKHLKL